MPFPNSNHRSQKIDADNPRSSKQSFQSQFEKFISNPILQSNLSPARRRASLPTWVVVDSLDECDDQKERSLFLKTILEAALSQVPRPESDVHNFYR